MTRYHRQMILPQVGSEGQTRLSKARVLVVGAGGLAAPALPLLAGAGVGHITVMDGDVIDPSNLHRQTLFTQSDCGRAKAEVAAERCRAINPEIDVNALDHLLTPGNAGALVANADVVLDCADSYAVSYILSDICFAAHIPLISASALGVSGYVGGFCGGAPSLRALFPDAPDADATCQSAGVLGPTVGTIGAMQAQMALQVMLGWTPSPLGQMVRMDLGGWHTNSFRFDTAPEPETAYPFIGQDDLRPDDLIFDLREPSHAGMPFHAKAKTCAIEDIITHLPPSPPRVVLGCATGLRAWRGAEDLEVKGVKQIALLAATAF
ncbi:MAG: HesA/MoeB/ThiF family protein [Planktomarina sp.]